MNDFTKDELQIMLLDMECYVNRTTILKESPSHKALRDKIQSMIDKKMSEVDYIKTCCDCGEMKLVVEVGKCPDCGSDMADYAGKRDDGSWWTGCALQCGYYTPCGEFYR